MGTAHDQMMSRIEKHGRQLLAIFPNATEQDPVKLCKKLRRLEAEAAKIGLRMCNGPEYPTEEGPDEASAFVLHKVYKLLTGSFLEGHDPRSVPIFVNRDPRGYALKINDEYVRKHNLDIHKDWGGYGIIAPDLTGE